MKLDPERNVCQDFTQPFTPGQVKTPGRCERYVIKRFDRKSRISPRIPDFFRIFFQSKPGEFHADSGKLNFIKIC